MTKSDRRARALALAVVAGAALSACGTGTLNAQPSGSPGVLAALSSAEHASSYRFSMAVAVTGFGAAAAALGAPAGPAGNSFVVRADGAVSSSQDAMSMTMGVPRLSTSVGALDEHLIVFLRTGVAYVSLSGGSLPGKTGKPWMKISGIDFASLTGGTGVMSPAQYLQSISAYAASEQRLGTVELAGQATTEYAISVDTKKVMQRMLSKGAFADLMKNLQGGASGYPAGMLQGALDALPPTLQFLAYVNQSGSLNRLVATFPIGQVLGALFGQIAKMGATGSSTLTQAQLNQMVQAFSGLSETVTMDFRDYGSAVDIVAPPADEVGPAPGGVANLGFNG